MGQTRSPRSKCSNSIAPVLKGTEKVAGAVTPFSRSQLNGDFGAETEPRPIEPSAVPLRDVRFTSIRDVAFAQIAAIRRWRGDCGSALIGLISL
jgi:hypothetical protein